jgi:hypothetical protein
VPGRVHGAAAEGFSRTADRLHPRPGGREAAGPATNWETGWAPTDRGWILPQEGLALAVCSLAAVKEAVAAERRRACRRPARSASVVEPSAGLAGMAVGIYRTRRKCLFAYHAGPAGEGAGATTAPVRPDARLGLPDFHSSTRRGGPCWGPRGARQGDGGWELAVARLAARVSSSHRRDWPVWPSAYIGLDANVYLLTMQGPPARAPALRPPSPLRA